MKSNWSNKWKKCLIWFSAYMSFIAYALVGGFVIVKTEDEDLKKTTKLAFIVSMIFAAISGFLSLFYNIGDMSDKFYGSGAYDFYSIATNVVNILKVVVFAVFVILSLVKNDDTPENKNEDTENK